MGRFEQDMRDLRSKTLQSLPPPPRAGIRGHAKTTFAEYTEDFDSVENKSLESVKAALASGEGEHKAATKKKEIPETPARQT
uniref:Uncharacterized protein n=1 Tax=Physcomitrium patens TaxID=3218 RepID=A0A2K1IUB6_PHYPA|nr:hypothetical protein PHYPA_024810 [Physcomitrium patens]